MCSVLYTFWHETGDMAWRQFICFSAFSQFVSCVNVYWRKQDKRSGADKTMASPDPVNKLVWYDKNAWFETSHMTDVQEKLPLPQGDVLYTFFYVENFPDGAVSVRCLYFLFPNGLMRFIWNANWWSKFRNFEWIKFCPQDTRYIRGLEL